MSYRHIIKNLIILFMTLYSSCLFAQLSVTGTANPTGACPLSDVTLSATASGSTAPSFAYSWMATSGSLSSPTGQQVTLTMGSSLNNDTVVVTCTDANHQSAEDTFVVKSNGIGIAIINNPQPIILNCGQQVIITTHVTGSILGKNYTWSNGKTGQSASTFTDSITGNVNVTVTNSAGCSASATAIVEYQNSVTNHASFQNPAMPVCTGSATFTNTSTYQGGGWSAVWSFDTTGNNIEYGTGPTITYDFPATGQYTVTLTMDSAGCSFSAKQNVTVQFLGITDPPSLPSNSILCSNSDLRLSVSSGYNSYRWSDGGTDSITVVNQAATYSVTITNSIGCSASAETVVTEYDTVTVSLSAASSDSLCRGTKQNLNRDRSGRILV